MKIRVGIPKALYYYKYAPLWEKFFELLGAEVIVSKETNKTILDESVKNSLDEVCLPVKIFHGHILELKDKVDYIFMPRIMSIHKGERICPKFCGLPEIIKNTMKDLPTLLIPEINEYESKKFNKNELLETGRILVDDDKKTLKAYKDAEIYYAKEKEAFIQKFIPEANNEKTILVLGHPYNLYDNFTNMKLLKKISKSGFNVITPEMIVDEIKNHYIKKYDGRIYWTFAREILGSVMYLLENKFADGVIYLYSFGCGIDSALNDISERLIKRKSDIPFMMLSIDEHTGEAGFNTRLEAFLDMIKWRDEHEDNVSTYGKCVHSN